MIDDLMPNAKLSSEPEIVAIGKTTFDAVVSLVEKGYTRAEIMEAIYSQAHVSAISSILKLRVNRRRED